jgi:AbiV family abortive infection protein
MSESIPVAKVPEVINKCMEKARGFFVTAKDLIDDGKPEEALIISVFGLEEFGRAVLFNDELTYANTSGQDFIEIERKKLFDHKTKQQAAMSILPEKLKSLAIGTFNPQYVESKFIVRTEGKIDVLQDLREGVTYVDFKEGHLLPSPSIDSNGLKMFIEGVEEESEKFLKYTVSYFEE